MKHEEYPRPNSYPIDAIADTRAIDAAYIGGVRFETPR